MIRFGHKNNLQVIFFSRYTLIFILALCILFTVSVYKRYTVEREMAVRENSVLKEYNDLEKRKNDILKKVDYLKGETGIESEIRKNFDVAKEGEKVVIIVDEENKKDDGYTNNTKQQTEQTKPWYKFW